MVLSRDLFKTWDCKAEYNKFRKFLYFVKKAQDKFWYKKRKAEMKRQWKAAAMIGKAYQIYKVRTMLSNANKILIAVKKCSRKIMFKAYIAKIRICKRAVEEIYERSWNQIEEKINTKAAKDIQRIWRGYSKREEIQEDIKEFERRK